MYPKGTILVQPLVEGFEFVAFYVAVFSLPFVITAIVLIVSIIKDLRR